MKVLLVNGSPHKEGCTHTALKEVEKEDKHQVGQLTQEEYAEIEARIRQEFLEEMKQGVQKHEGREDSETTE